MYGGSVAGRLVEKFNGMRESEIGIAGAESGERRKARIAFDANPSSIKIAVARVECSSGK
jgi:hypothetical protein